MHEKNKLASIAQLQKDFYGIFGQINLASGAYLILIEEAALIGDFLQSGSDVLRVEKLMYIPLTRVSVPITV